MRILVTGGAGGLGSEVVRRLAASGHVARVMSRRPAPADLAPNVEWVQADVEQGTGVPEAVQGVEVIVNAMSDGARALQVDIEGTRRLLEAARSAGVGHVLHVSIVGIEHIPNPYYEAKVAAEQVVMESGVPWSIWRATQFHTLLDGFLAPLRESETAPILQSAPADALYQLLDTAEAADALLRHVDSAPAGRLPDVGGPEVLRLDRIAAMWLEAQGIDRKLAFKPSDPGRAAALRQGLGTAPANPYGSITWADYLETRYGRRPA
jgi:uncharacterized protein YbjT (DUF2867 family)